MNILTITIKNQTLLLSPDRAVFWQEQQALILSDLHIGKGGHFRKAGIPIPGQVQDGDLLRLEGLVKQFHPKKIIVVGDMFHSHENGDLEKFRQWREAHSGLEVILVKGNHDILKTEKYHELGIELVQDGYAIHPFVFSHHPIVSDTESNFIFSGHLHPGVALQGAGKQKLKFPCFWFSNQWMVLPAFSRFTGLFLVKPAAGERIVAMVEGELMEF